MVSSFPPTSFSSRNRHCRAPHSFAPNSGAKDRAPNNSLPRALPRAGCQSDYRKRLPAILVAPVLSHTYGLQELALPDTPWLGLPAAEPGQVTAPAVARPPAVLAQPTSPPALGPLQVACSSTIKGFPDSAYVQVKYVREPIFRGKRLNWDGCQAEYKETLSDGSWRYRPASPGFPYACDLQAMPQPLRSFPTAATFDHNTIGHPDASILPAIPSAPV
jgi:hypothetical protein